MSDTNEMPSTTKEMMESACEDSELLKELHTHINEYLSYHGKAKVKHTVTVLCMSLDDGIKQNFPHLTKFERFMAAVQILKTFYAHIEYESEKIFDH